MENHTRLRRRDRVTLDQSLDTLGLHMLGYLALQTPQLTNVAHVDRETILSSLPLYAMTQLLVSTLRSPLAAAIENADDATARALLAKRGIRFLRNNTYGSRSVMVRLTAASEKAHPRNAKAAVCQIEQAGLAVAVRINKAKRGDQTNIFVRRKDIARIDAVLEGEQFTQTVTQPYGPSADHTPRSYELYTRAGYVSVSETLGDIVSRKTHSFYQKLFGNGCPVPIFRFGSMRWHFIEVGDAKKLQSYVLSRLQQLEAAR